jgi:periplasmic copper chaperone A
VITGLLLLLPAALLFASLVLGHYPGEHALAPRERLRAPRPRPAPLVLPRPRTPHRAPRPARLVATAIAARPPPSCGRTRRTPIHTTPRKDTPPMKLRIIAALGAATALAVPAAASAHVTLQPNEAAAGGFARLDVRVPNERDDAGTTKVAVKMPPGIFFASYEPVPGWSVQIEKRKLAEPVEVEGERQTEEVDTVTIIGRGDDGIIEPGQFRDFGLSVNVPDGREGTKLKFPATQTYDSGEVVRWIGPENADEPAPVVTLTAAEGDDAAAGETAAPPDQSSGVTAAEVDDKADKGLTIAALVIGALGLVAGIAGLLAARRSRVTA